MFGNRLMDISKCKACEFEPDCKIIVFEIKKNSLVEPAYGIEVSLSAE